MATNQSHPMDGRWSQERLMTAPIAELFELCLELHARFQRHDTRALFEASRDANRAMLDRLAALSSPEQGAEAVSVPLEAERDVVGALSVNADAIEVRKRFDVLMERMDEFYPEQGMWDAQVVACYLVQEARFHVDVLRALCGEAAQCTFEVDSDAARELTVRLNQAWCGEDPVGPASQGEAEQGREGVSADAVVQHGRAARARRLSAPAQGTGLMPDNQSPPLDPKVLAARITEYLALGGLFNPELMDSDRVRDMLIDCRDYLAALSSPEQGSEAVSAPPSTRWQDSGKVKAAQRGLDAAIVREIGAWDHDLFDKEVYPSPHDRARGQRLRDEARQAVDQFRDALCSAVAEAVSVPQPTKMPSPDLHARLCDALQSAWNDYCDDAGCHPECFTSRRGKLFADFSLGGEFTRGVAARLERPAVSVPPEAEREALEKVLRDTETYKAMLAQDRYPANFGEQAKGVEGVVLPLGSTEAVTRLLRDLMAWSFGMGQAQPESSEMLSWHERAEATTAKLREHFAASQGEAEQGREGVSADAVVQHGRAARARRLSAPAQGTGLMPDNQSPPLDPKALTPAQMDEGIHQARRIITSAAGYRFGDDLVPFDEHFKALALDAIAAAHRSAVVALVDGDREQEGTVVPTTRYMECKCLPDSHVPPNPFCEVHGRPSIAAPSGQGVGEDYRSALVTVMAHTGRCGMDGHTHDLSLANGLLDSIARIVNAALATPPAPQEDTRDAKLWRWFRDRAWVGTTEDSEIFLSTLVGEPADVECLTDAERELFENDSPDAKDMSSLCQRIAEWHADVPAALPSNPSDQRPSGEDDKP